MAALNFPNSPSTNDLHTENGVTFKWNGTIWKKVGSAYTDATNLNVTGISTVGSITGVAATFTGNVQIGGVLTYEDVKNVDSVGVITARSNVYIKNTFPRLYLQDTDSNSDFSIINSNGAFMVYDDTNSANRFTINSNGIGSFNSDLEVAGSHYITDSIIHTGDTNTKIRFPAADVIAFETGGTERLRIGSTGLVTIQGNSANAAHTHLKLLNTDSTSSGETGQTNDIEFFFTDNVGNSYKGAKISAYKQNDWVGNADYDAGLAFYTVDNSASFENAYTERLRITADGSVNIGGNSTHQAQTTYPLSVSGSTGGNGQINIVQRLQYSGGSNQYNNATVIAFTNTNTNANAYSYIGARIDSGSSGANANALVFATNATDTAPTERLRITSAGTLKLTGQSTSFETAGLLHHTNNNLYIRGGTTGAILQSVDGNEAWVVQNTYVSASTGGSERLHIDANGKIGVGLVPNAWQSSTTSKVIQIGNSSVWDYNLQQFDLGQNFYYDGSNYKYIANGYATKLAQLKSDGSFIFFNAASGTGGNNLTWLEKLKLNNGYAGTVDVKGIPAHLRLYSQRDTSDWDATDPIGKLDFYVGDDTTNNLPYNAGFIHCLNENNNVGEPSGALVFGTTTANLSGGAVERLRIQSDGRVAINIDDARFGQGNSASGNKFYQNTPKLGVQGSIVIGNLSSTATDVRELAFYRRGNTNAGTAISTHHMGRIAWYGSSNDSSFPDMAWSIECNPNGNGWTAGSNRHGYLSFISGRNGQYMRLNSAGYLGVGHAGDPSTRLHVQGNSDGGAASATLTVEDTDTTAGSMEPILAFDGNGTRQGRIMSNDTNGMYFGVGSSNNTVIQLTDKRDLYVHANSRSWATMRLGNIRYHCRQHHAPGNAVNTTSLMRVKRYWWGWGSYKITAKLHYYGSHSGESTFFLNGHGNDDSYSIKRLDQTTTGGGDNYYGGSSLISITSPSNSSPGNSTTSFVDVQINIPNYTYAIIVMECMSSQYTTDPTNMGNDSYCLL